MKMKNLFTAMSMASVLSVSAFAVETDELNPYDPNINEIIQELDAEFAETAEMTPAEQMQVDLMDLMSLQRSCYQRTCAVFIHVHKATQTAELFENGTLIATFKVSTGTPSHPTPNFDRRPEGRIFDKYSSSKYPGGDYAGLGNMPYVVFIRGGFGIHGTPKGNWKKLGTRASHGCIRVHPDNGKIFNRLVRKYGVANSWITVN